MSDLVTLTIDGIEVTVPKGTLVVDAAKRIGKEIPVFCYHPKMDPAGMCRMCLVDVGMPVWDRASGEPVLDADGNPDNGITITEAIADEVDDYSIDFTQSIQDFGSSTDIQDLFDALNALGVFSEEAAGTLLSAEEAQEHLEEAITIIESVLPGTSTNYASGTYSYNPSTRILSFTFTSSDFSGCGPEAGDSGQLTVLSLTSTTMVWLDDDGDQETWTRTSGTSGDIVGTWSQSENGNMYVLTFRSDGSVLIVGNITSCEEESASSFTVPYKWIDIDGRYYDWSISDRIYLDTNGPDCGNAPGQDIQEVYLAQDNLFIYLRFVLNGPLDETFGYKFGDGYRHIYVADSSTGGYIFYGNAYGLPQPSLPSNFVHVSGNQFECKFYKSDVAQWKDQELAAWCDQGSDSVCRDYISLPEILGAW